MRTARRTVGLGGRRRRWLVAGVLAFSTAIVCGLPATAQAATVAPAATASGTAATASGTATTAQAATGRTPAHQATAPPQATAPATAQATAAAKPGAAPARAAARAPRYSGAPRGIVYRHNARGVVAHQAPMSRNASNPSCGGCAPPLLFTPNEPVMGGLEGTPGQATITPVFWAPSGYSFPSSYTSLIDQYLSDVAAASGSTTNVFSVATEYYQQLNGGANQQVAYDVHYGGEVDVADAYPAQSLSTGCTADSGYTACVDDQALQQEVQTVTTRLALPTDDSHLYMVFFPPGVETCAGPGDSQDQSCSTNVYCGYHSWFAPTTGTYALYANMPYANLQGCADPYNGAQAPNGDPYADAEISIVSHEANETITDWAGAWYDANGYEDGDECAYVYGAPLGGSPGAYYNQVINGHHYYTQDEFSNAAFAAGQGNVTSPLDPSGYPEGGSVIQGCVQRPELQAQGGTAGYWEVGNNSQVFNFGGAPFYGDLRNTRLNKPVVGMAPTADQKGYWMVASDGGIFTFGDAPYYGSMGWLKLNKPVVGMAATPDGKGYWLVAADGGIFTFGDAPYYGSTGNIRLNQPVVGMAVTPDGKGYWLVAADGGIFTFGDAGYYGSLGGIRLNKPVVGMVPTADGKGYWLIAADGGVFTFGDARYLGSLPGEGISDTVTALMPTTDNGGYEVVGASGTVYPFGDAPYFGDVPSSDPGYPDSIINITNYP